MPTPDPSPTPPPAALGWFVRLAWLGPALLAGLFLGIAGLGLWVLQERILRAERQDLHASAASAQDMIRRHLRADAGYFLALAGEIPAHADPGECIQRRSAAYLGDHPEIVALRFRDAGGVVRWTWPAEESPDRVGAPPPAATTRAGPDEGPTFTAPLVSRRGEVAFELHVPVVAGENPRGTITVVFSCEQLLRSVLPRETIRAHHVALLDATGNVLAPLPRATETDQRLITTAALVEPPGAVLRLERYGTGFWGVGVALLGLLCVALVFGMAWGMWSLNRHIARRAQAEEALRHARDGLADRVRERTADLEQANERLQSEIVQRQRAQDQARQRQEQLAHVGRLGTMGEMAAGLAHELNQPLGAISSYADGCLRLLESHPIEHTLLYEALDAMAQQARRAGRIIHRLRDFVAQAEPKREMVDLRTLAEELVDLLAMDLHQEQIELVREFPLELPRAWADPIQVQQVLLNLMRNAVDVMCGVPADRRRLTVSARQSGEGEIEVCVRDTGPGCGVETREQMFDPFFSTKETHLGMGLSISRSLVQAHGGRLWAEAEEDTEAGLALRFTLPTEPGDSDASYAIGH